MAKLEPLQQPSSAGPRASKHMRILSPIQVGLLMVVALMAVSVEVLILQAFFENDNTASDVEHASYVLTNLANIQREALLLQIETDRFLDNPESGPDSLKLRRALLANQLKLQSFRASNSPQAAADLAKIQSILDQLDLMLASLFNNSRQAHLADIPQMKSTLSDLEIAVKTTYDREEQAFFAATSKSLNAQRTSQILLLAVSGVVLISGLTLAASLRRSIRAFKIETTERARAEQSLRETTERLDTVINNSPIIMFALDSKGIITLSEGKGLESLGQRPGQVVGQSVFDVYRSVPRFLDNIRQAIAGDTVSITMQINGLTFDFRCEPIRDQNARVSGVVGVAYDVTALKQAEAELELARDMALEASRTKSEFLASMSHEIRTPMNAIIGMGDLLSESRLNKEQREYLRVSTNAGESLLTLINDILDISKVEAGLLELEDIDFDLGQLIESTAETLAVAAHEKHLELNCRVRPDVPVSLIGDPSRLRQVLTNLLGNAIKFTQKGEVALEVENDPEADQPGSVRIHVSDTGIGIPEEKLEEIFGSFTQVDSSTTREYGGTGLGLAITRRLIELMGGYIKAESELGQGSTFTFTARFDLQPEAQLPVIPPSPTLQGLKTLVVDDNADNRMILRELLSEWGASVTAVDAGYQGLAHLARMQKDGNPCQLLLLDARMPGMDGFQVVEHARNDLVQVDMAIMMLTSDNRREDIPRCKELGISNYLVKPIKKWDLRQAITNTLERITEPADIAPQPVPRELVNNGFRRILLVEDSRDNRFLIQSYLKHTSFEVEVAENGEIAVEKFKSNGYDLVLMDMQMPVMDGYTATRTIRELEQERSLNPIPILALTAHALKDDAQKSLAAGCNAHITKPIKKAKLIDIISEYMGSDSDGTGYSNKGDSKIPGC